MICSVIAYMMVYSYETKSYDTVVYQECVEKVKSNDNYNEYQITINAGVYDKNNNIIIIKENK